MSCTKYFNINFDNWAVTENIFKRTFKLIFETVGTNAFKRYNLEKDEFFGGFIVSAFEMVALGVAHRIEFNERHPESIISKIKTCWVKITSTGITWKGYSASGRLPKTVGIGQDIFNES